ncbi:MAG: hypothetical protein A4E73_02429 [Syntrophaceae bacterium PtaU1.Bin231]|nr:MAG: hypothetical protein A4E73_02429 [Syntrophaceae bacterium PtaU1.Bin231]
MDPLVIAGLVEIAKGGLMLYFQSMRLAGKTDAEIRAYMAAVHEEYAKLDPKEIPDV